MKKIIQQIIKHAAIAAVVGALTFLVVYGQYLTNVIPQIENINSTTSAASFYPLSEKKMINRSRQSAVRVLSFDVVQGMVSTSSATYFEYGGEYFILTTSHGLLGGCDSIQIEAEGELYDCEEVLVTNEIVDYAILRVDKINQRKPIKFPRHMTTGTLEWKKTLSLLNEIVYTGYPNSIGPLTIEGTIMGFDSYGLIYVQSYAWSGSSGSGVFDKRGNLIGYILAIDVGNTEFGNAILENVILVVPIYKVDWSIIFTRE